MSYRQKAEFDRPTIEDVEKIRRTMTWLLPIFLMQQGLQLMDSDRSVGWQLFEVFSWSGLTVVMLAILLGWKLNWISDEDHRLLNDEWQRDVRGNALRWALVALVITASLLMAASVLTTVEIRFAINLLVGIPLATAGFRMAWLNRGELGEDE